jgi:hypothetical protein
MLTGELAVTKVGESGREITLYRIGAGESCILSTLALIIGGIALQITQSGFWWLALIGAVLTATSAARAGPLRRVRSGRARSRAVRPR